MNTITRILLVDDKEENLLALTSLLENRNREIITATTGEEALRLALEKEIALIMLDVQMPGMDGYEVASILKSSKKTKQIPIIFVTAINTEDQHVLKGFESGGVDFLFKPLQHEITRAKVNSFIRLYEQQKQLEQKNDQLRKLSLMVENSVSGMCTIKGDRLWITSLNEAFTRLTGISSESELPSFLEIFPGEEKALVKEQLFRACKSGNNSFEARFNRADGINGCLQVNASFVDDAWFLSLMDITEKKSFEEDLIRSYLDLEEKVKERTAELSRATREMQEFVSAVSHDLRAPIRGISSLARWICEDFADAIGEDGVHNLDLLRKRVEKLDNMIKAVVEYSRLGKTLVTHDVTDTGEVIREVVGDLKVPEGTRIEIADDLPVLRFNKEFLGVAIRELLLNAIKYNDKDKPTIEIGAKGDDKEWQFYVKDNGLGIPEKNLEEIFKVFYSFDPREDESVSAGMGLPYVRKIIGMKNGRVWAESTEEKGTVVWFTIPKEHSAAALVS